MADTVFKILLEDTTPSGGPKAPPVQAPPVVGPKAPPVQAPPVVGPPSKSTSTSKAPVSRDAKESKPTGKDAVRTASSLARAAGANAAVDVAEGALASNAANAARGLATLAGVSTAAGVAITGVGVAIAAMGIAVKLFADSVQRTTDKLGKFSAAISIQQSQTEVRRLLADVERARRLGPQIARVQDVKDRAAEAIERLGYAVWEPMLRIAEKLIPLMERGISAIDLQTKINEGMKLTGDLALALQQGNQAAATKAQQDLAQNGKDVLATLAAIVIGVQANAPPPGNPLGAQIFGNQIPAGLIPPQMPPGMPAAPVQPVGVGP